MSLRSEAGREELRRQRDLAQPGRVDARRQEVEDELGCATTRGRDLGDQPLERSPTARARANVWFVSRVSHFIFAVCSQPAVSCDTYSDTDFRADPASQAHAFWSPRHIPCLWSMVRRWDFGDHEGASA